MAQMAHWLCNWFSALRIRSSRTTITIILVQSYVRPYNYFGDLQIVVPGLGEILVRFVISKFLKTKLTFESILILKFYTK